MATILVWLKRIIAIGLLEFLRRLGWRVWAWLLLTIVVLVGLVVVLALILISILL